MLRPKIYEIDNLLDNDDFVIWVTSGYKINNKYWEALQISLTESQQEEFDAAVLILSRLSKLDNDENSRKNKEFVNKEYDRLMKAHSAKKTRFFNLSTLYKYAAVLLVLVSVAGTLFLLQTTKNTFATNLVETSFSSTDILIQTPDQKYYKISKDENKKWLNKDGVWVDINSEAIRFSASDEYKNIESAKYKVIVPEGENYTVVLIDSTNIELNANTNIAFNNSLNTKYRHVDLQGEAFFDVAHEKNRPFIVQSSDLKIRVLGTEFNVSNYKENNYTSTTLIDGSIDVSNQQDEHQIIKPGYQAIMLHNQGYMEVKKVNVQNAVSWTNNRMIFTNETLENILKRIGAWYPQKFIIKNEEIKQFRFTGTLKKENSLEHFLQILKYTKGIQYTITGKEVTLKL